MNEHREKQETRAPAEAGSALDVLASAIGHEAVAVRELRDALRRQRGAVAANDATAVNASVDAIHGILIALSEARRARGEVLRAAFGDAELKLDSLERVTGAPLPLKVLNAAADLKEAAEEVAGEATINGAVLRHAVQEGEAFLQHLFSSVAEPSGTYAAERRDSAGAMINRRA